MDSVIAHQHVVDPTRPVAVQDHDLALVHVRAPAAEIAPLQQYVVSGDDYLAERLENYAVKVTRIASGVPMGGDLKYVDPVTLKRALDTRHDI